MIGHWLVLCHPSQQIVQRVGLSAPQRFIVAQCVFINFLDCCAITVPVQTVGPPVGLMIVGEHGADRHLLGVGRGIEAAVNRTRLAP
jgi:Asp-tRNA(Asn)/Glu-tRNA(Gln) amidotransferase A subunit family amidase